MLSALNKLLRPLRTRIANMVSRAVVNLVDDALKIQGVQLAILDGETREACERFQQYGFTSVPLAGAEAVVLFPGGRRDHGLVVAVDDRRYRLVGLGAGEVALYASAGQRIVLKADGSIEVGGGTMQPAALGQDVRDELDDIRSKFASHTHVLTLAAAAGSGGTGTAATTTTTLAAAKTVKSATVKVTT